MALEKSSWELLPMPEGKQELPEWLLDAKIYWSLGFSNGASVWFYVKPDSWDWPNKVWDYEDGYWRAYHPDGRFEQHFHSGKLTPGKWKIPVDCEPDDPERVQAFNVRPMKWKEVEGLQTTEERGYAGRGFTITRSDGVLVQLRGPWHTGAKPGYHGVTTVDAPHRGMRYDRTKKRWFPGKWWNATGCFGPCVSTELLLKAVARFEPTVRACVVTEESTTIRGEKKVSSYLDWLPPEWPFPKLFRPLEGQRFTLDPARWALCR